MIPGFEKNSGGVLLSHPASQAVPSALKSLTSVFGMVTGVTSSLLPPKNWDTCLLFSISCLENAENQTWITDFNLSWAISETLDLGSIWIQTQAPR